MSFAEVTPQTDRLWQACDSGQDPEYMTYSTYTPHKTQFFLVPNASAR